MGDMQNNKNLLRRKSCARLSLIITIDFALQSNTLKFATANFKSDKILRPEFYDDVA